MKKIILICLMLVLLSVSALSSDDIKIGTPIIDGLVDTSYLESYKLEVNGTEETFHTSRGGTPNGSNGDSATAYYLYDDSHLYVCVVVNDDAVFSRGKGWIYKNIANLSWENDAVEARVYYPELGDAVQKNQYIFQCDAKGIATTNYLDMCLGEHMASTSYHENGYIVEFSLPLSFDKKAGDEIGLSIEIDDLHEAVYGADTRMGSYNFNAYGSQHPYENMVKLGSERVASRVTVFDDTRDHWGRDYVSYVFNAEIFKGMGDGFSPDVDMTRAMFVTVLGRMYEKKSGALVEYDAEKKFDDVDYSSWYGKYVSWANGAGIVKGYENNTFRPDNSITREEMAVMLCRYANAVTIDLVPEFSDSDKISPWAKGAIAYCARNGLISGKGNNEFAPKSKATRAEVAKVLAKYMQGLVAPVK